MNWLASITLESRREYVGSMIYFILWMSAMQRLGMRRNDGD